MNKKIRLIFLTLFALMVGACSKATIEEERTIVLDIDSEVVPNFTSNYGSGSYDETTKKYTHKINSIKDLYITLSYEDLKSLTVYIPTSEMNDSLITKSVEFGETLDAEVEITVEGVKSLEGIEFEENANILNLQLGKKNTFKFTLPSREKDEQIKFTLPGYKKIEIDISKDLLVSGQAKISTIASHVDQVYIALDGSEYTYNIYSMTTNELVSSGSKYSYSGDKRSYILLPNTDSYYMSVYYHYRYLTKVYKININENFVLDGSESCQSYGHLSLTTGNPFWIYDKVNKIISIGTMTNNINALGIIIKDEEDKWVYIDELKTTHLNGDTYNHYYEVDYSVSIPVQFDVTRIHSFTNDVISSGVENNFIPEYDSLNNVEFENNTFKVTIYENEIKELSIDVYDKNDNVIGNVTHHLNESFDSVILRGTMGYQGKKIPYQFPLFKEDIVYNDGTYTYIGHPVVNTEISLVEVIYVNGSGGKGGLSDSAYLTGPDGLPILRTETGENNVYFEVHQDIEYTLHNETKTYKFTFSSKELSTGQIVIWDSSLKFAHVKLPTGYYLEFDGTIKLYPDSHNMVDIPILNDNVSDLYLSNGLVTICLPYELSENQLIELNPFYSFDVESFLLESTVDYEVYAAYGIDSKIYYYIKTSNEDLTMITNRYTNLGNNLTFTKEDFIYDEDLNAYFYSFEDKSKYVLNWFHLADYSKLEFVPVGSYIYVLEGDTISYNGVDYDLSSYGSKKLNISMIDDGIKARLEISSVN